MLDDLPAKKRASRKLIRGKLQQSKVRESLRIEPLESLRTRRPRPGSDNREGGRAGGADGADEGRYADAEEVVADEDQGGEVNFFDDEAADDNNPEEPADVTSDDDDNDGGHLGLDIEEGTQLGMDAQAGQFHIGPRPAEAYGNPLIEEYHNPPDQFPSTALSDSEESAEPQKLTKAERIRRARDRLRRQHLAKDNDDEVAQRLLRAEMWGHGLQPPKQPPSFSGSSSSGSSSSGSSSSGSSSSSSSSSGSSSESDE